MPKPKTYSAQLAATIRADLRSELGVTSRQVSVRKERASLCVSINVEVKDAAVDFEAVKRVAQRHERIRRCEVTGDILGGGNTYVSVFRSIELWRAIEAEAKAEMVEAPAETIEVLAEPPVAAEASEPVAVAEASAAEGDTEAAAAGLVGMPARHLTDWLEVTGKVIAIPGESDMSKDAARLAKIERILARGFEGLMRFADVAERADLVADLVERYFDARAKLVRLRTPERCWGCAQ